MENKIIVAYDRKSVQAAVEYVNTYRGEEHRPVTFAEMCKKVEEISVDIIQGKVPDTVYRGVLFYFEEGESENPDEDIINCKLYAPIENGEPVMFGLDLTEVYEEEINKEVAYYEKLVADLTGNKEIIH